jgi:two-component system sensor histidine kinase RegB
MVERAIVKPGGPRLRLETLVAIRWLAILGQTLAVMVVAFGLGYEFHLSLCLALIAMSAWLNVFLRLRYRASFLLSDPAALALLCYDLLQLSMLLFLTGGLQNPFAVLLVVPVVVSAATQSPRFILPLGGLTVAAATLLVFFHQPLPWETGKSLQLPLAFVAGTWVAIVSTLVFTAVYAYRVADEARKLSDALAATELVLQREQHLSNLDGLAAAAAHELGTPLATIALVSKEMMRELSEDSPLREDASLLRSQAERCRQILQKLSSLSGEGDSHIGRLALSSLMEEVAAPHRSFGVELSVGPGSVAGEPVFARNPGILYGLGNLVENAVDFAGTRVEFTAAWDAETITIVIRDDGPGFAREMLERLGEPFLTSRRRDPEATGGGLGLGLFIAKTLLERSGAQVDFANSDRTDTPGAIVTVRWLRPGIDLAWQPDRAEAPLVPGQ